MMLTLTDKACEDGSVDFDKHHDHCFNSGLLPLDLPRKRSFRLSREPNNVPETVGTASSCVAYGCASKPGRQLSESDSVHSDGLQIIL